MEKPFSDNRSTASSVVSFSHRWKQRSTIRATRERQCRAQRFRRLFVENLEIRWVLNAAYLPPTQFLFSQSGPLTPPAEGAPLDIALSYLQAHAGDLGLAENDLRDPLVTDDYTDADTGLTHIYLRQRVNDLEVDSANFNITVDASGEIVTVGGGFVRGLFDALDLNQQSLSPDIGAIDAVTIAAEQLGLSLTPSPEILAQQDSLDEATTITAVGVSLDDIPAHLHYVPTPDGSAVLAWELIVRPPSGQDWFDLSVPATSDGRELWGHIVSISNWVARDSYNVIPPPNESPQDGGFSIITNPADPAASPFGWHDTNGIAGPEFTDTRGNNVDAHLDRNNDNVADASPPRPGGGPTLDFSGYVLDPSQAPTVVQNQNVAQVNLFYINNIAHDIHYQYGFTELAGNFQTKNYTGSGLGNDAVQADAQDGGGTNNANFNTPPDGSQPRMQMYLFNTATPQRDGDLDNGVILHEYGHGVSNRLTGGPANSNALTALQSGGMGEGWSDFYALMFTQRATDTQNAAYPQGTYVLNQAPTGNGSRTYPYSYDMSIDPHTWNDYGTVTTEVHYAGEIWTSALWDMNWLLINKYGYDSNLYTGWTASAGPGHAGNKLALKLVMDAMKVQPANPSFIDARNAILAADNALNDGADILEIWTAFARRGLGENASTANSGASSVTTSFTVPAYASSLGIVSTSPAVGSIVPAIPGDYLVNFSYPFLTSSLDASDFQVDGLPADSVDINGPRQATFHFNLAPFSTQGLHTMSMAAGAMLRASDGTPIAAFTGQFRYDLTPLVVTSTSPASGGVFALPGPQTFDVNFSEPILPSSVQTSDLVLSGLSGASVSGVTVLAGNTTARFTITGSPATEGTITASIAAGAISDAFGNPGNSFSASYAVDLVTRSYPTPLTSKAPLGSLIYDPSATATINSVGDTDTFTLAVDPNQTITVLVTPSLSVLRPSVQLLDPSNAAIGSNTAGLTGQNALLQTITVTTSGTYSIVVSGASSTTGGYTVQVILNAALENEGKLSITNNTIGTAQDLSASFMTLATSSAAPTRGAVTGQLSYSATAVPFSFTNISTTGTDITTLTNADNSSVSTTIPFTFNFYGTNFTSVFVSSNGLLTFSSGTTSPANATLSTNPSQAAIAPFWDDLRVTNSTSTARVKTQTFGSVGSRQFVIQWDNVTFFSGGSTADPITFQAILNEGTNAIQFNYLDLVSITAAGNNGASATVGIKAANSANGQFLELANNNGPNTFVGTSKSTLITPTDTDYYSFSLAANETATIAATGLSTGTLNMDLRDAADAVLAAGVTGSTNVTSVISNFTVASSATYYVRVSGNANVNFSLVITKNAAFDTEPNDSTSTPQNVGSLQTILGSVSSNVLYGMNKVGQLFTVNTTTGVGTSVGSPLPFNSTEIEFDNTARRAFAQASDGSFFGQEFNITTGATIGSTITNNASFTGLEWVGATLYGAAFSGPGSTSTLRTLNAFTGTSTTIGSTGFGPLAGLAYDTTTSTMYGITGGTTGTLVTVNLTTGAATTVGATGFRAGSLEFGPDGLLYGGGTGATDEGKIFRINKATGAGTLLGQAGVGATGSRDVTGLTAVFNETDDWYSITVSSLAAFRLDTSTPADGANQFVNTLNPHIELIDPSNNIVSSTALADGRNESILYTPSVTGTYRVHVTAEGGTSGEYVITRTNNAVLYWDADGIPGNNNISTGAGLGGTGSWDTSTAKWFDGVNDVPWSNSNTTAIFMGTAGNVSLAAPIIAGGLTFNTSAYTISSSSSSNTLSLTGGAQINVSSAAFTDTISAPLTGSVGPATTGPGILVLSNSNNNYSGATTINAGTLRVSALNAIPSGSAVTLANVAGATLNLASSDTIASLSGGGTTGGNVTLNSGTTLTVGGNNATTTYAGIISGSNGALTKSGTGTFILTGANTYSGATTISSGVLQIGNGSTTGSLGTGSVIDNSSLVFNRTVSSSPANVISGGGTVTIATGQVNLTGNSTYTGTTTINSSASLFLGLATTGSLNPASAIINNGRFGSQRSNTIIQGIDFASVISGTGGITEASSGGGTLVLNGANTYTGSTLVSAGTIQFNSILNVGGGASALGAPTTVANGTISLGTTISTPANLVYVGAGNVTNRVINLTGNSAATVGLAQSGTGLLKFTSNFTSSVTAPKTLNLSGSTAGAAEIAGAIVNNSSTNTTSLTKSGSGTWTLSGTSSYTGATTVNAGTLIVTGNTSTSATTVANVATLAGTGTTDGVTVNSGGTLAPGLSPGILNTGNLSLVGGSTFRVELNGITAGMSYDQANVTGTVSLGGATLNVSLGFSSAEGDSFVIINNDDVEAISGAFDSLPEGAIFTPTGAPAGNRYQITYVGGSGNDVFITHVQAPTVSPPADQQGIEGELATIGLGYFSDADGNPWTVEVDWGDGLPHTTFAVSTAGSLGQQTHTYADEANWIVTVTVTDAANLSHSASFTVTVADAPPKVSPDSDAVSAAENSPAINTGTWSDYDDAVTLSASIGTLIQNGDGTWIWSNTYDDDGTYTTIVTAQNTNGSITTTSFEVSVANVAPTLTISGAASVDEASTYTLNLMSFDPGADTIDHWTIDWGDGAPEFFSGNPASVNHIYADGNVSSHYTISATATDDDGLFTAGNTVAVTVNNVSPVVSIAGPANGIPLTNLTFTLSPTDPSAIDQAAGFTYLIDWGDGSPVETSATATVSHAYASVGSKSVAITAIDKDNGASAAAVQSLNIVYALSQGDNLLVGGTSEFDAVAIIQADGGQVQITMNGVSVGTFLVLGQVQVVNLGITTDELTFYGTSSPDIIHKSTGVITLGNPVSETITYTGSFSLVIDAGAGNDTITDPGANTKILGGPGDDTIIIDGSKGGGVVVDGGGGSDTYIIQAGPDLQAPVTISDSGTTGGDSVLLSGTAGDDTITQTNSGFNLDGAPINIGTGLEAATIDGRGGSDEVVASGTPAVPIQIQGVADMVIPGTSGDDRITFTPGNIAGQIVGTLNNVVVSRFSPTGRLIAYGGDGNDNIQIAGSINLPAWLYGEAGNDRLNAGNGGSLLLGGDGNDELIGGGGRDVMIGGNGADNLIGNANDDILVAGYTLKDDRAINNAFWSAVLTEWNSLIDDFSTRVQKLRGVGGLTPQVVDDLFGDQIDFLNGSSGDDWLIFAIGEDKVAGKAEAAN
jgi:extracellular elastinolytic metalloproteinase